MTCQLTPYEVCLRICGSPERLAPIFGVGSTAPYRFANASKWRDAGDLLARYQRRFLVWAVDQGLDVPAAWMIFGADEAEVAALLGEPVAQVAAE